MKVLHQIGVPPEADYAYDINRFTDKSSTQAEHDAAAYKISEYHQVTDFASIQAALAAGQPIVLGIDVYGSFESGTVANMGKVPHRFFKKYVSDMWTGGNIDAIKESK